MSLRTLLVCVCVVCYFLFVCSHARAHSPAGNDITGQPSSPASAEASEAEKQKAVAATELLRTALAKLSKVGRCGQEVEPAGGSGKLLGCRRGLFQSSGGKLVWTAGRVNQRLCLTPEGAPLISRMKKGEKYILKDSTLPFQCQSVVTSALLKTMLAFRFSFVSRLFI